jgi:hypothetical protein
MMKLSNILLIVALLWTEVSFADDINGHFWDKMDESYKVTLISGYINGYTGGTVHGAILGLQTSSKFLNNLGKDQQCLKHIQSVEQTLIETRNI